MEPAEHGLAGLLRGWTCHAGVLAVLGLMAPEAAAPTVAQTRWGGRVVIAQPPKAIDDFELTDQQGRPFKFSQLRDKTALVFFGLTHCPDVCPATLLRMRAIKDSVDQRLHNLEIVMISVDGDRDTPATMKAYLAQVSPQFIGLTGDAGIVRKIAAQFSAVFFKGLPDRPGGPYAVGHTSQVSLIDRQGRLRATFYDAPVEAMEQVARSIEE